MIIKSAEFVTSAVKKNHYPPAEQPEIAFAGRSNVGKSSLMFVDLPGFGYARVPQKIQKEWGPMIETYLLNRETLRGVVLIMDIRRNPGQYEFDLINWLSHHGIPCLPVMTKADKLKKNQQTLQHKQAAKTLGMDPKDLLLFSTKTRQGKEMIWTEITRLVQPEIQPQTLQEDNE